MRVRGSLLLSQGVYTKSARVNRRNAFVVIVTGTQFGMFRKHSSVTQVINEVSHCSDYRHKFDELQSD
jgi:hypothetical protein